MQESLAIAAVAGTMHPPPFLADMIKSVADCKLHMAGGSCDHAPEGSDWAREHGQHGVDCYLETKSVFVSF
jgi:hypothetical protein